MNNYCVGDEYDIVILTTVRSQKVSEISHKEYVQPDRRWLTENLGFLTDEHQINVGITRARYGLIIIGKTVQDECSVSCFYVYLL